MSAQQSKDLLHGVTLEKIVNSLVDRYGWSKLGERIRIKCFNSDPSVKSSLKFLRKTPWAREKVESLYLNMSHKKQNQKSKQQERHTNKLKPENKIDNG